MPSSARERLGSPRPEQVERVLARALDPDPELRYADARLFLADLLSALGLPLALYSRLTTSLLAAAPAEHEHGRVPEVAARTIEIDSDILRPNSYSRKTL